MSKKQRHLINLALTAMLTAVSVVLGRFFSYNVQDFSIGFGFLPIMVCGMICGVWWGGICGALADFIGAMLFPFGVYFPGFTATAFLMGTLYGLIGVAERRLSRPIFKISATVAIIFTAETLGTWLINSLWLSIMYGAPYPAELLLRLPQAALYFAVKTAAAIIISRFILSPIQKSFKRG